MESITYRVELGCIGKSIRTWCISNTPQFKPTGGYKRSFMVNYGSDFHWSFLSLLVSSVVHSRKKPLSYKWKHLKSLSVLEEKRLLIVQAPLQTEIRILMAVTYGQSRAMRKPLHYSSDSAEILPGSCLERYSNYEYFWNTQGLRFCWNTLLLTLLVGSEGQTESKCYLKY